jgi:hypothetical protein
MAALPTSLAGLLRHRWVAVGAAAALTLGACGGSTKTGAPAATTAKKASPATSAAPNQANNASALTGNTPCEKAGPPASEGQVLDGEGHFHRGPTPQVPVSEATRKQLEAQQIQARAVVAKYQTVADAVAAGYRQSTVYVPCIGAHYTNVALAGTNDHWHQHTFNGGLCMARGGLVIGAESMSAADCAKRGGQKIALTDIWMLHDWAAPGWECSWGVFASECPELGGKIGLDAWHA